MIHYEKAKEAKRAWKNYHRAVAELGPDHPITEQLYEVIRKSVRTCFFSLYETIT